MPENSKVIAIVTVESILGAKLHKSLVILQDGVHQTLGKAVIDGEPLEAISIRLRTESGVVWHTKQQGDNHQKQNPSAAQVHANKRLWALVSINSHKLGSLRDRTHNNDIQKSLMITSDYNSNDHLPAIQICHATWCDWSWALKYIFVKTSFVIIAPSRRR